MITYLVVRFYVFDDRGNLRLDAQRLPFRKLDDSAVFPVDGPSVMPADIHERGCPEWCRLIPGYTAWYAGVRYVDLADWCRKWRLDPPFLLENEPGV